MELNRQRQGVDGNSSRSRLVAFIIDLLTVRLIYGILILVALGLLSVYYSFNLAPPGAPESFWSFLVRWLGMGLIVTAATSAALQIIVVKSYQRFRGELDRFLEEDVTGELEDIKAELDRVISGRRKFGFVCFHSTTEYGRFDFSKVFSGLEAGDELLWLDTYAPTYREFQGYMEKALKNGAKMRMLVIDPNCQNAKDRALEIARGGFAPKTFSKEVEEFRDLVGDMIIKIARESPSMQTSCRVRIYDDLPCVPMYLVLRNNKAIRGYNSLYLTEPTAYFVHLEWQDTHEGLLRYMHEYFENKWNRHSNTEQVFPNGFEFPTITG